MPSVKPTVCIDIATYANLLLQNTEAEIYPFEPLAQPFETLSSQKTTLPHRFFPINKGVVEKNETLLIHFNDKLSALASFAGGVNNVSYIKNKKFKKLMLFSLTHFVGMGLLWKLII